MSRSPTWEGQDESRADSGRRQSWRVIFMSSFVSDVPANMFPHNVIIYMAVLGIVNKWGIRHSSTRLHRVPHQTEALL